jgi:hypothetical protein
MKSLSETLLAAQRSASAVPYVRARFAGYDGYARRRRYEQHYAGSEDVHSHAACIALDGSLVRARVQTTGTDTLYVSRVAAPGPESTFASWTALDTDVSNVAGVALCVVGTDVWLFYLDNDDVTIRLRVSSDNGATWGAASTVLASGGAKTHIAATASDGSGGSSGHVLLIWAEGAGVYRSRWDGSAWGARTASTQTFHAVTGLATAYLVDWQVAITGRENGSEDAKVWATRYGDGGNLAPNTWGALREVTGAAAGSQVSFAAPSLAYDAEVWRLLFVESYAGDAPYTRLQASQMPVQHDFQQEQWREPVALAYEGEHGAAVAISADREWLCSAETVWSSLLPAVDELDVSARVQRAECRVGVDGAEVTLELDVSGGVPQVERGARLELTPGYVTGTGPEAPSAYTYWVESARLVTGARPGLVVRARDGWSLLERWRARRQFVWPAGTRTVSQLLLTLLTRAGLEYEAASPSAALGRQPAFTLHAGESGATAVRRLLSTVEDLPLWDGHRLLTLHTDAADEPAYNLGGGHAVVESEYHQPGPRFNRARVAGLGVYGEAFDFQDAQASGERVAQVVDVNLTSGAAAVERAAAVLRKAGIASREDKVRLFGVHCGVELWDVVSLTDAQAGLEAAPRRVTAYAWRFRPEHGRYDMTLTLGEV